MRSSLLALAACLAAATASAAGPTRCSGDLVRNVTDGTALSRCYSAVTPASSVPLPVLFWFHGAGGSAANCGDFRDQSTGMSLGEYAHQHKFALVCGEAVQNLWGRGGLWAIPEIQTDTTGPRCGTDDTREVTYLKSILTDMRSLPKIFDVTRIFTSGCSMGSAFSEYSAVCLHKWLGSGTISAFATHSTGLKVKGDGNTFPPDSYNKSTTWGECDGCQYFPTVPQHMPGGLKGCFNDNYQDPSPENPFFYRSTVAMASAWRKLGNRAETQYSAGGHCQIKSFGTILSCLDDGTGRLFGNSSFTMGE